MPDYLISKGIETFLVLVIKRPKRSDVLVIDKVALYSPGRVSGGIFTDKIFDRHKSDVPDGSCRHVYDEGRLYLTTPEYE